LKPFEIITVAKVGSASFKKSLEQLGPCPHSHNLLRLKNILKEGNRTIISGIRNPIDRNLSYFFQTYGDNFFNSLKTQKNGYKGENCFVKELVNETRPEEFIRQFFLQKNLYVFNDWFEEFLAMTEISSFDKESGLQLYELKNIKGVKDATGDLNRVDQQLKAMGKEFIQLTGNDDNALEFNKRGGVGAIGVTANVAAKLASDFQKACVNDQKKAVELDKLLQPLHTSLFIESNPSPVKYAASLLGMCKPTVRLPLVEIREETKEKVLEALKVAKLL